MPRLTAIVTAWVRERPRDEVLAILDKYEALAAAVNDSSDIVADPHFAGRTWVAADPEGVEEVDQTGR